jgi:hypothetical protein
MKRTSEAAFETAIEAARPVASGAELSGMESLSVPD